ncbi:SAM-dependent methyltransferase [Kiloniella spongiae]|uniref:SAM-dependent methyltransferase n=1 Tax=Kiloniella spongiae TaxID=1489064 RepID=A0A0H2MD59_9PROT|nr:class I SAM-dependent methyltransferase [Kiloniella spongiae]KLN60318.1 SAM-dependent methyltransferase [Kiloniella spongiae]
MANKLDTHIEIYNGGNLYDFDNGIILKWYPERIMARCADAKSLLELGLGHGHTANIFSENFDRYLVLDGSSAVIDNFHEKYPDCSAEIIETYFEEFDTDEKFDVIVMGFILEHVDDPKQIITRYKQYLAPGGKLFIAVPNAAVMNRRLGVLAGLLDDVKTLSDFDHISGHQRYYTVETLASEIKNAGFKVDIMEGLYLKPLTTSQMLSLNLDDKIIAGLCTLGIDYPELSCGLLAEISIDPNSV